MDQSDHRVWYALRQRSTVHGVDERRSAARRFRSLRLLPDGYWRDGLLLRELLLADQQLR